jgi:hypothetical protein
VAGVAAYRSYTHQFAFAVKGGDAGAGGRGRDGRGAGARRAAGRGRAVEIASPRERDIWAEYVPAWGRGDRLSGADLVEQLRPDAGRWTRLGWVDSETGAVLAPVSTGQATGVRATEPRSPRVAMYVCFCVSIRIPFEPSRFREWLFWPR